jgi:hypothetical protein
MEVVIFYESSLYLVVWDSKAEDRLVRSAAEALALNQSSICFLVT